MKIFREFSYKTYVMGGLLLLLLILIFKPVIAAFLAVLVLFITIKGIDPRISKIKERLSEFVTKHASAIVYFQCCIYALAYESILPNGMYYSPDSVTYLVSSNVVPPNFPIFINWLIKTEIFLGGSKLILLRYLAIVIYSCGGYLLARALLKSGRNVTAIFILPTIWSMSSLTQWFNYFLTDGLATGLIMACLGAYANLYVSINRGCREYANWAWLVLFVLTGMLAFATRPAFAFIVPVMLLLMFNRDIFRLKYIIAVILTTSLLTAAHFSFGYHIRGSMPSQLGGVLTALVFDLPIPNICEPESDSNLCRTQGALKPFIKATLDLESTRDQYIYKVLNNGPVVQSARAAVKDGDPNYSALREFAFLKIMTNPVDYVWMVLSYSYYSVKVWGDWAWNDSLGQGSVAMVNIGNTNAIAPAIGDAMYHNFGIQFDPTITDPPKEYFYKNILFQLPRLIISHKLVSIMAPVLVVLAIIFIIIPLLIRTSLPMSILFACCAASIVGTIFQNAFFPVIPRLLDPFHPLAALGVIMFLSCMLEQSRKLLKQ